MVLSEAANLVVTICAFLVAVGIVVFVHEFGHYAAARLSGIGVKVFSVGFGKAILAWRDSQGTIWKVGAIPLGGYVRFTEASESEGGPAQGRPADWRIEGDSLSRAALRFRVFTVLAGPLANFVFSCAVFAVMVLSTGIISGEAVIGTLKRLPGSASELHPGDRIVGVNGLPVESLTDLYRFSGTDGELASAKYSIVRNGDDLELVGPVPMPPVIDSVRLMSAASDAGLKAGDVVLAIDGVPISRFDELRRAVESSGGQPLSLVVWREGEQFGLSLAGRAETLPKPDGGFETRVLVGVTGGLFFEPATRLPGLFEAVSIGAVRTASVLTGTIDGVVAIATAQISSCNLQGPVGIARVSGAAAAQGTLAFVSLVGVISAVIGLLNLLPIPGLDGGHLAFYIYEALFRRPPSNSFQRISITVGFVLVAMLMAFGLFNDLTCA